MSPRFSLRQPGSEPVLLDVAGGIWVEPERPAAEVIGHELWALPGLVDAHAHFAAAEGESWVPAGVDGAEHSARRALEAGVMLALDKGWSDMTVLEMLARVGPQNRPDIEAAGVVLAVDGGYWPDFAKEIDPAVIAEAVGDAAKEANGWVKLIGDWPRRSQGPVANFNEEQLRTAVDVATGLGARVAIHTMAREVPSLAVSAGVHSIEHGMFLDEADLALLGQRGGMWVPTVLQVDSVITQLGVESSGGRLLREGLENVARLLDTAVEAGVHVLTGTDLAVGPRRVAEEAIRLWEMGMSASAVVAAVSGSGLLANDRAASFEPGEAANAVFYESDPIGDPRILAHPKGVLRLGRLLG